MKIAIIGVGAIGSYVAAKLSTVESIKLFLLPRSNFGVIATKGIILTETSMTKQKLTTYRNFTILSSVREMPVCDIIILCVKSNQTTTALYGLKNLCHANTMIVTLQNGLDFEHEIARAALSSCAVYSGTCWIKVSNLEENHVRHDFGSLIKLGQFSGEASDTKNLVNLFLTAGLTIEIVSNIFSVQLTKLALNIPFFILSSLTGASVTEILSDPALNSKCNLLQEEIIEASEAIQEKVDMPFMENVLNDLKAMKLIPPKSRSNLMNRMKEELPESAGALLIFFRSKNINLPRLNDAYDAAINLIY